MIKNIIYDLGNVLIDFTPRLYAERYTENTDDARLLETELYYGPEWLALDKGEIEIEDALVGIQERLPAHLKSCAREAIYHWHDHIIPRDYMTELVASMKEGGYKQYLLSNAGKCFSEYQDRLDALKPLDGIVVSAFEGLVKPDAAIFQHLLSKFSLKAEECLFIDDLPVNIEGAIACGLSGYCYADQDFEKLLTHLLAIDRANRG